MRVLTIGTLVGARVVDAEGQRVGTVVDVAISKSPPPEVVALILGAAGLAQRVQIDGLVPRNGAQRRQVRVVLWAAVEDVQGRRIRLRPGWKEQLEPEDLEWRSPDDTYAALGSRRPR